MSRRTKLTRRQFLYLSTLATAGAVASACAPLTPECTGTRSSGASLYGVLNQRAPARRGELGLAV